ncbi:hypothetical protein [Jeotgalibacillus malaysiensis]|uniref:hypothetical protein n=1 Tax=Jeotgalibacillus malaysiensis TaxID=1508404 RepID=UPI00384B3902
MQKILFILSIVLTGVFIFLGYNAWQDKQAEVHRVSPVLIDSTAVAEEDSAEAELDQASTEEGEAEPALTTNLPQEAQDLFAEATAEEPVNVTLVATESATITGTNWLTAAENVFSNEYSNVVVETITYNNTSDELIETITSENYGQADVILLEVPTIYDNGFWSLGDQTYYMNLMIGSFQEAAPEAVLIMQPSQPLAEAPIYDEQKDAVQQVIADAGIEYLDHWSSWGQDLSTLLTEDNDPTEEGGTVWANYMTDYLTGN